MARKKNRDKSLKMALAYRDLLLYEVTCGNMGKKPEITIEDKDITFSEKKALLSEMIKLAELERKNSADTEEETGFDSIRKQLNDSAKTWGGGDSGGSAESSADESTESEAY